MEWVAIIILPVVAILIVLTPICAAAEMYV